MFFSFATLALFAVTAAAQNPFPDCALNCLQNQTAIEASGCSGTDNPCLCRNQAFIDTTTTCITGTCQGDDLQRALTGAQQLCAAVGVTLTSTPASLPTSSSSGSPASGSGSSTVTRPPSSSSTSGSQTTAPPATTSNAALVNGIPAFVGLAAFGLAALAL